METSTKKKNEEEPLSWLQIAGAILVLIIMVSAVIFLFVQFWDNLNPDYPDTEIIIIIDERIVTNSSGRYEFVLRCHFENSSKIVLVLNAHYLENNMQDYYDLASVEIGEGWYYKLIITEISNVYYVIDLTEVISNQGV